MPHSNNIAMDNEESPSALDSSAFGIWALSSPSPHPLRLKKGLSLACVVSS